MPLPKALTGVVKLLEGAISLQDDLSIRVENQTALRENIEALVRTAVLGSDEDRDAAQWLIRVCAQEMGAIPSSIHDLYIARGRGDTRNDYTVPAVNLRSLTFHAARAVFRALDRANARALIFEIARSEIGYTDQPPAEYAANVLGAAVAEGYQGPVFIQGDHFQVSAKRFANEPEVELTTLRGLVKSSISAGFFNIDIDTSTLVDLSKPTVAEQQDLNFTLCAELAKYVRDHEPPQVTISIGGEIGEVGGHNSTEEELRAFMDGYNRLMDELAPGTARLSKISVQTGTSHGGVVLPDGSIAEVNVDFDTLKRLSDVSRDGYGMGGAVQHGASTLPVTAFSRFAEVGTCEVHLATNFQNILYDHLPEPVSSQIYAYLDEHHADERKPGQSDEQFRYKTRKRALGPFKKTLWDLSASIRNDIEKAWEAQFDLLFDRLNIKDTQEEVERHVTPILVPPELANYMQAGDSADDVSDLAD